MPIVRPERVPRSLYMVRRSARVCVGWQWPPSPALMSGMEAFLAATSDAPSIGCLIAMMSAITAVVHMMFHFTIPIQAGTALVIVSGIALGPEAGFLIGALGRFVCNFYLTQGAWTPWQMFCWGILGFLAGLAFNKANIEQLKERRFNFVAAPVMAMIFALIAAYTSYLIIPGKDGTFFGWRLYAFGAAGLVLAILAQHKRLPSLRS